MTKKKVSALRVSSVLVVLLIILVVLVIISLRIGSVHYSVKEIFSSIGDSDSKVQAIILNLRLPRAVLSILIGMCLASSGALLQAVMRNPLADPGIIGVSSGASVVATTILLVFPSLTASLPLFAFLGGAFACLLIYALAWNRGIDPLRIILSGVAVNSIFGGVTALLQLLNSEDLGRVLAWLNGSLSAKSWSEVKVLAFYGLIGLFLSLLCIKGANALQLGDNMARNLGLRVNTTRMILSAIAAFLAASTVAVAGIIGFVGLIVPHISRMLVGSDYKVMLPTGMLLGSCIVLFADTVGRTAFGELEIPLGIIMAVLGGPFFLYLLRRGGKSHGN